MASEGQMCETNGSPSCTSGLWCDNMTRGGGGVSQGTCTKLGKQDEKCWGFSGTCQPGYDCMYKNSDFVCRPEAEVRDAAKEKDLANKRKIMIKEVGAILVVAFAFAMVPAFIVSRYYGVKPAAGTAVFLGVLIARKYLSMKKELKESTGWSGLGVGLAITFMIFLAFAITLISLPFMIYKVKKYGWIVA